VQVRLAAVVDFFVDNLVYKIFIKGK
jgi:hypothetical protein